jgi:hypothetical protein
MRIPAFEIVLVTLLLAGSVAAGVMHSTTPLASPAAASEGYILALSSADLVQLKAVSSKEHYQGFLAALAKRRFESAKHVYEDVIPRLAESGWRSLWGKADAFARGPYERLHQRVESLGRQRFEALEATERMDLIRDRGRYEAYLYKAGVEALPETERRRISSSELFRQRQDRDAFIAREGWYGLTAEEQASLGSPSALSKETTPEKLAFFDRVALPRLEPESKAVISGINRDDLRSLGRFTSLHGEAIAQSSLRAAPLRPTGAGAPCRYTAEETGSLFRGGSALCNWGLAAGANSLSVNLTAVKTDSRWLVGGVSENLLTVVAR